MPKCKNDKNRTYKGTEPSPKGLGICAHVEKIGLKLKGNDDNTWIIKQISSGSKRWIKFSISSTEYDKKINCFNFVVYEKKLKSGKLKIIEGLEENIGYIYKFIEFNKFENKETKIPIGYVKIPLPITKEYESDEWLKIYRCDNSKKLLDKHNKYFKLIKHPKTKKYFILNKSNIDQYLVYVGKNNINIYSRDLNKPEKIYVEYRKWDSKKSSADNYAIYNKNSWAYIRLVKKYKPLQIFIGKDQRENRELGYESNIYDGNSILLKIKKNRYVFIGYTIYEFSTNDKIIKYYSPMIGAFAKPFPVAIGEKYIYYMEDVVYIPINKFENFTKDAEKSGFVDEYNEMWENDTLDIYKKKIKILKKIDNLESETLYDPIPFNYYW